MDNTNVKVQFNIIGEDFCPTEATDRLQVIPTKYWVKGDGIPGKIMKRVETTWMLESEYEESLDINDQLSKIVGVMRDKKHVLKKMKTEYNLQFIFAIVVNVENNVKPSMYFNHDFIEFVSEINAEFYIDLYIYS